ncbi:MAG: RnfABCDGE type electron transport complex subunit D [Rhodocyclaceae bacterium]|nr:RnfABCDGE type electron transport complex subunit D [Rhodocyclaceae bacterium]
MNNSPYFRKPTSIQVIMFKVLVALLPAVAAYVWLLGAGILVNVALASITALAGEAAMLKVRGRPITPFLSDGSALVTAWLIALTFPPLSPWWLTVAGTLFAVVVVKQLYGGLGQNPFNPAMAAFAVMIVAFPALMSQWPSVGHPLDFSAQLKLILGGLRELDAITGATPLDALRTGLRESGHPVTITSVMNGNPAFGMAGGKGWELIVLGYLLGGLWLWQQKVITWHIPLAFLAVLGAIAGIFHLASPEHFASPLFHLASGGAMLGAFFILTDPISSATTPRGKLVFAAGAALLTWIIRSFGAYPDGVAFSVLLMNILVPLIDMYTQPPIFGHKEGGQKQ